MLPYIQPISSKRQAITKFAGMNTTAGAGANEFTDLMNMTNEDFPALSVRKPLELLAAVDGIIDLIAREDAIYYLTSNHTMFKYDTKDGSTDIIHYDTEYAQNAAGKATRLTAIGAYIVAYNTELEEDSAGGFITEHGYAKYYNTVTGETGSIYEHRMFTSPKYSMCYIDGTDVGTYKQSASAPSNPKDGDLWLNTETDSLMRYSSARGGWVSETTAYIKITISDTYSLSRFQEGDAVVLVDRYYPYEMPRYNKIHSINYDEGYFVVTGLATSTYQCDEPVDLHVIREFKPMDYLFPHESRLWGCSSKTHEVRASATGNFWSFEIYDGLEYDSWGQTIGSDGSFTGACSYGGYPYFFKKDKIYKVYGSLPSEYSHQEVAAPGGEAGTIAEVNGVLYYKADRGIYAFTGSSFPTLVSRDIPDAEFGNCAAVHGDKYMIFSDQNKPAYVYDTIKGTWTKLDTHGIVGASMSGGDTYLAGVDGILSFGNSGSEYGYDWHLETAIIGTDIPDDKQISQVRIRFKADKGTRFNVYLRYDGRGAWEKRYTHIGGANLKSEEVPIRPRRCDYFQMRIEGEGGFTLQSIAYNVR